MENLQNTQIIDFVHKLPTQKKLILLATILHDKHIKKKYFFKRYKLKEIYEIYLELCKKTFNARVNKKWFLYELKKNSYLLNITSYPRINKLIKNSITFNQLNMK